jgi:hypothetical protein
MFPGRGKIPQEGITPMRNIRIVLTTAAMLMIASNLPAPVQGDCQNQPDLRCYMTCTYGGCEWVVTPDNTHENDFCYVMGGTNCMGGTYHRCC